MARRYSTTDYSRPIFQRGAQSSSSPTLRSYHKLRLQIKPNADCSFCQLVYHIVTSSGKPKDRENTECLIEWVLADHKVHAAQNYTRRIRISWSQPGEKCTNTKIQEVYLIYAPPLTTDQNMERPKTASVSEGSHSNSILAHVKDEPGCVDRDWNGDIDEWIRQCIHICYSNHPNRPERHEEEPEESRKNEFNFRKLIENTWFRVIDIKNMKLGKLPLYLGYPEPYVALSYCWGKSIHKTTKRNHGERFRQSKSLILEDMPPNIRNAIELVSRLGLKRGEREVRYMWIDSLCIVQDDHDARDWERNAENMDLIFGNAFFTICAADEPDDGPDGKSADEHTQYGLKAMYDRRSPEEKEILPGLKLVVSRSSQYVLPNSKWNKRGWTFQEHLLSRRCLIFTGNRIYFQCRMSNYDDTGIDWSTDWRKSALLTVDEVKQRPIQFYMKAVSLYTGRDLTDPKDILKAFGGVISLVEWYTCARMYYGLPSSHFDFVLLWRPKEGKGRRHGFPSWSWSGWQREDNPGTGTSAFYPADVLEGELADLNRWLLDRTWIQWYIQDVGQEGVGKEPRPLWDGYHPRYPERVQRVEGRWKGYDGYWSAGEELPETPLESTAAREREVAETIRASRDSYGRHPRWLRRPRTHFSDNIRPSFSPFLRFYTWRCEFFIRRDHEACSPGHKLARVDVLDQCENWCGTVVVDDNFVNDHNEGLCTFLALSETKKFTDDECPSWTYPIPKNKEDIDWDLFNVMVVELEPKGTRPVFERRGVGKILKVAFENGNQSWEEITLG